MTALSLNLPHLPAMPPMLRRGLLAGSAWGVALATGLIGLNVMECGAFCAPDALATIAVAIPAGVLTIGPLAAIGR